MMVSVHHCRNDDINGMERYRDPNVPRRGVKKPAFMAGFLLPRLDQNPRPNQNFTTPVHGYVNGFWISDLL
jgi:hypothetical protein